VEVLDWCLQIQSKTLWTLLPDDAAGSFPFPADRSCRSSCNSVSSLEQARKCSAARCKQQMSCSLSDMQEVCQNLLVLLELVPSKVSV